MKGDKPTHGLVIPPGQVLKQAVTAIKNIWMKDDGEDGVFVSLWPSESDGQTKLDNNNGVRVFEKNGGGR